MFHPEDEVLIWHPRGANWLVLTRLNEKESDSSRSFVFVWFNITFPVSHPMEQ
jgi:hypothetical protein